MQWASRRHCPLAWVSGQRPPLLLQWDWAGLGLGMLGHLGNGCSLVAGALRPGWGWGHLWAGYCSRPSINLSSQGACEEGDWRGMACKCSDSGAVACHWVVIVRLGTGEVWGGGPEGAGLPACWQPGLCVPSGGLSVAGVCPSWGLSNAPLQGSSGPRGDGGPGKFLVGKHR